MILQQGKRMLKFDERLSKRIMELEEIQELQDKRTSQERSGLERSDREKSALDADMSGAPQDEGGRVS